MTLRHRTERRALSHLEPDGRAARMVDVAAKPVSTRSALARARIIFPADVLALVLAGRGPKGPITEVARAAGVLGAKRTSDLIPMCHGLALDHVELAFDALSSSTLEVRCRATCRGRTGVEMEALVGATLAALTVYDMTKALSHAIRIDAIELLEKRGGRSGTWTSAALRDSQSMRVERESRSTQRAPNVRAGKKTPTRASSARSKTPTRATGARKKKRS